MWSTQTIFGIYHLKPHPFHFFLACVIANTPPSISRPPYQKTFASIPQLTHPQWTPNKKAVEAPKSIYWAAEKRNSEKRTPAAKIKMQTRPKEHDYTIPMKEKKQTPRNHVMRNAQCKAKLFFLVFSTEIRVMMLQVLKLKSFLMVGRRPPTSLEPGFQTSIFPPDKRFVLKSCTICSLSWRSGGVCGCKKWISRTVLRVRDQKH